MRLSLGLRNIYGKDPRFNAPSMREKFGLTHFLHLLIKWSAIVLFMSVSVSISPSESAYCACADLPRITTEL